MGLEDPGYPSAYDTVRHLRRQPVPLPVDGEGLMPDALEQSGVGLAYVTPSHQFPMGMAMPISRSSRLLQWAGAQEGRYLGIFSRSITPSIRIAYRIPPPLWPGAIGRPFPRAACTVSRFEQETLRRPLSEIRALGLPA